MNYKTAFQPEKEKYITQEEFLKLLEPEGATYVVHRHNYLFRTEPIVKCIFSTGEIVKSNITGLPISTPSNTWYITCNESELANLVRTNIWNLVAVLDSSGVRWVEEGNEVTILG